MAVSMKPGATAFAVIPRPAIRGGAGRYRYRCRMTPWRAGSPGASIAHMSMSTD